MPEFCQNHVAMAERLAKLEIRDSDQQASIIEMKKRLESLGDKVVVLGGIADHGIPTLTEGLKHLRDRLEEKSETWDLYTGQIGEIVTTLEELNAKKEELTQVTTVLEVAMASLQIVVEAKASVESVTNCYRWVKGGFVAAAVALLLLAVKMLVPVLG